MTTYSIVIRNKFCAVHASTGKDFVEALREQADFVETMLKNGVEFTGVGVEDDYAEFVTEDERIAEKCGMVEIDYSEETIGHNEKDLLAVNEITSEFTQHETD